MMKKKKMNSFRILTMGWMSVKITLKAIINLDLSM